MGHILVVDDDHVLCLCMHEALTQAGHEVTEAHNGSTGISLFERIHPDLVIADLVMPDHEGLDTIRSIRRQTDDVPIIAISGYNLEYLKWAVQLGADASLPKPFAPETLSRLVDMLMSGTWREGHEVVSPPPGRSAPSLVIYRGTGKLNMAPPHFMQPVGTKA